MSQAPKRLVVQDLQKSFRKTTAVESVSLSLAAGERLGIIGPNGAGKSTTVKMITGQILPDSGEVHIDGHRIDADAEIVVVALLVLAIVRGILARLHRKIAALILGNFGTAARCTGTAMLALADLQAKGCTAI